MHTIIYIMHISPSWIHRKSVSLTLAVYPHKVRQYPPLAENCTLQSVRSSTQMETFLHVYYILYTDEYTMLYMYA